jgi:hypothetical protein
MPLNDNERTFPKGLPSDWATRMNTQRQSGSLLLKDGDVIEDASGNDRIKFTDAGSTIIYDEADNVALTIGTDQSVALTATKVLKADTISEVTAANGVVVDSVTLKDGGVTATGAVVANNTSNDIAMAMQIVVGADVTLATDNTTTVSSEVIQPANTILMGVGMLCTAAFTIASSANMGLNVGTDSDGSGEQIVALDPDGIYSNSTTGFTQNSAIVSWNGGPMAEAGNALGNHGLKLVSDAEVYITTDRNLYFKTTSSSGNPTAGAYKPLLFVFRIA